MPKVPIEERDLNEEQRKAVEFGDGPLMIIAGAGTGKTTVITERIKYLITSGKALPQEILALTFTEKASREMEERVDRIMPYGITQMWISTFHSFCDRILRNEAINIGVDSSYRLMTEAETILFLQKNIFRFELQYFRPYGNPTKFISGMLTHFNKLRDEDVTPNQYIDWVNSKFNNQNSKTKNKSEKENEIIEKEKFQELANAYRTYEELKVQEGIADYADLISLTLKLFRTRPMVLARYQKQFKYILIDEFQDTNIAQNELAVLLAGKKNNITVVGDDDQAIYRWRGAAISNMIQFKKTFPRSEIIVLTNNYRSTREILERSYNLIQHNNPDRLEIAQKVNKKLSSMRGILGDSITLLYADRVEDEAEEVVKNIKYQMSNVKYKYEYKDFAILVRANNHTEPFARALSQAGIPYQFLGPGQLFRQSEVKDLIAYLKVLYNFEDNIAMYRVLSMETFGIPPRDIAAISNFAKKYGLSLFESCETLDGKRDSLKGKPYITKQSEGKVKQLTSIITRHLGLIKKETAGQILYYFLEDTGLLKRLAMYKTAKEERIAANISKFFNKLKTYEFEHEEADVFTIVDWIDLSMVLGESPLAADTDWNQNNAVNIMTVHSAKGLEFPVVFLVNLVSQRFPTNERSDQIPIPEELIKEILPKGDFHTEEERRLFYVGMTRARDLLYLSGAKFYGEGKREKKLSPFIEEALGKESVTQVTFQTSGKDKQLTFLDWEKKEEKEMKTIHQRISFLSYTRIETFKKCPLQYKYRYIVKLPVPPSAALTFGDTIHRTMFAFYTLMQKGEHLTRETLLQLLDTHWSSIGFGNKQYEEKMKAHGRELLIGFYERGYDPSIIPISLEEAFKIKITPQLTIGGRIDRIDKHNDGTLEIIDYKTGTAPKSRDVSNDPQLTVYALSASSGGIFRKISKKVIVSFYFFEGQIKISATRNQAQLEAIREEIKDKAEEIKRSEFLPTPGKHCDFCEFRLICDAWRL